MELIARTRIPFPRELVFKTIRDRLPELVPHLPNVKNIETQQRADEGQVTRFVNVWTAKTEIPAAASSYIKPDMLKWTDRAVWDETTGACEWTIETHAFPGVVECSGRNTYIAVGDETELEINGKLLLHLEKAALPKLIAFTARPVIERIVVASLKPNLVSIGTGVTGYLRAQNDQT